jgi:hypothetical protein
MANYLEDFVNQPDFEEQEVGEPVAPNPPVPLLPDQPEDEDEEVEDEPAPARRRGNRRANRAAPAPDPFKAIRRRKRSPDGPTRVPKPSPTALTRKNKPSMLNVLGPAPGETMYSLGDAVELGGNLSRQRDGKAHRKALACTGNSYVRYAAMGLVDRAKRRLDKSVQMAAASRGFQRRAKADYPQTTPGPVNGGLLPSDTPIFLKFVWQNLKEGLNPRAIVRDVVAKSKNELITVFQPEALKIIGPDPNNHLLEIQAAQNASATGPAQVSVKVITGTNTYLDGVVAILGGVPFGASDSEAKQTGRLLAQSLSNAKRMWSLQSQCKLVTANGVQYQVPKTQARSAPWELYEGYRLLRVAEMFPEPPLALYARRLKDEDGNPYLDFFEEVPRDENDTSEPYHDTYVSEHLHQGAFVAVSDLRVVPVTERDPNGNDVVKYDLQFVLDGRVRSTADPLAEVEDYEVTVVRDDGVRTTEWRRRFLPEGPRTRKLRLYIRPNDRRVSDECVYATIAGTSRRLPNRLKISRLAMHFWEKCGAFNPEGFAQYPEPIVVDRTSPVQFPPGLDAAWRNAKQEFAGGSYEQVNEAEAILAYERARNLAHNGVPAPQNQPVGFATTCSQALDHLHELLGSQALAATPAPLNLGDQVGEKLKSLAAKLKTVVVPDNDCAPEVDEELSDDRTTYRISGPGNGLVDGQMLRWSQLSQSAKLALRINRRADDWFNEQIRWIEGLNDNDSRQTGKFLYWEVEQLEDRRGFSAPVLTVDGQYDMSFADFFPAPALLVDVPESADEIKTRPDQLIYNPFLADPTFPDWPPALQSFQGQIKVRVGNTLRFPYLPYRMPVYNFTDPVDWDATIPNPDVPIRRLRSFWPDPKQPTLQAVYFPQQRWAAQGGLILDDVLPLLDSLKTANERNDITSYGHLLRIIPSKKEIGGACGNKLGDDRADNAKLLADVVVDGERDAIILGEVPVVNPARAIVAPDPGDRLPNQTSFKCRPEVIVPVGTPAGAYWEAFRSVSAETFLRAKGDHRARGPGVREMVSRQFRYGIYNRLLQHWLYRHGYVTPWLREKRIVAAPAPNPGEEVVFDAAVYLNRLSEADRRFAADLGEEPIPIPAELAEEYVRNVKDRLQHEAGVGEAIRHAEAFFARQRLFEQWGFDAQRKPWFYRFHDDRGGFVSSSRPAKSSRAMYPARLAARVGSLRPDVQQTATTLWVPDAKGLYGDVLVDRRATPGEERTYRTAPIDPANLPRVKLDGLFGLKRTIRVRNGDVEETKVVSCLPSDTDWLRWVETATPADLVFDSYNLAWSNYEKPYGWETLGLDFASLGLQFEETKDADGAVVNVVARPRNPDQPDGEATSFSYSMPVVRERPEALEKVDLQDGPYGDPRIDFANAVDALQAFDATREYYIRKYGRAQPGVAGLVQQPPQLPVPASPHAAAPGEENLLEPVTEQEFEQLGAVGSPAQGFLENLEANFGIPQNQEFEPVPGIEQDNAGNAFNDELYANLFGNQEAQPPNVGPEQPENAEQAAAPNAPLPAFQQPVGDVQPQNVGPASHVDLPAFDLDI